ncbi:MULTISPECIES: flagellar export chaperone FliS [unclassified Novosphingobium]|jgi:flagellin-specific chaperone FliS|uniref:flagellar export chaperone FliS n=1 Tax=unclassified Novosphingobium TaxID=2644732 RepID=UPI000F600CC3|nr:MULTISPECIES: flagellar protein FliS [unclassified Novosphingobium]MBF5091463.1 flagellin [Novosphingobium sp. NBM11]RQW43967.1 flagellin [Novosphingobium sp. LASN5T]
MRYLRDPSEAYRRVDFDARVFGADPRQLVDLCLEQFTGSLSRAIYAAGRGDNAAKSAALTRAVSSLLALEMGVDTANPTGPALIQLYQAARRSVLDSAVNFDAERLTTIRADFLEIRQAMLQAARG